MPDEQTPCECQPGQNCPFVSGGIEAIAAANKYCKIAAHNALLLQIKNLKAMVETDESACDELQKLMAYAREVAGRRDVHSVYEVLDALKRKADFVDWLDKTAPMRTEMWRLAYNHTIIESARASSTAQLYAEAEPPGGNYGASNTADAKGGAREERQGK